MNRQSAVLFLKTQVVFQFYLQSRAYLGVFYAFWAHSFLFTLSDHKKSTRTQHFFFFLFYFQVIFAVLFNSPQSSLIKQSGACCNKLLLLVIQWLRDSLSPAIIIIFMWSLILWWNLYFNGNFVGKTTGSMKATLTFLIWRHSCGTIQHSEWSRSPKVWALKLCSAGYFYFLTIFRQKDWTYSVFCFFFPLHDAVKIKLTARSLNFPE